MIGALGNNTRTKLFWRNYKFYWDNTRTKLFWRNSKIFWNTTRTKLFWWNYTFYWDNTGTNLFWRDSKFYNTRTKLFWWTSQFSTSFSSDLLWWNYQFTTDLGAKSVWWKYIFSSPGSFTLLVLVMRNWCWIKKTPWKPSLKTGNIQQIKHPACLFASWRPFWILNSRCFGAKSGDENLRGLVYVGQLP